MESLWLRVDSGGTDSGRSMMRGVEAVSRRIEPCRAAIAVRLSRRGPVPSPCQIELQTEPRARASRTSRSAIARSCAPMPTESKRVIWSGLVRPGRRPAST